MSVLHLFVFMEHSCTAQVAFITPKRGGGCDVYELLLLMFVQCAVLCIRMARAIRTQWLTKPHILRALALAHMSGVFLFAIRGVCLVTELMRVNKSHSHAL